MGVGRTEHELDMWMHVDTCRCMQMHADAWGAWDSWDGWPGRQARASGERRARDGRRVWTSVGESRLVS